MLFINGISDYTLRYNGSGIHTPSSQMNLKNVAIHQVGKFQGPALPQRNIPKDDSAAYLLVSEDLEQDESKGKRETMGW